MSNGTVKILLVEDNPADARLIREMLAESQETNFAIDWVPQLSAGLERLALGEIDLVLLDLGLPDSRGLDTFVRAHTQAPQVPFIVFSGLNDETVALTAVQQGAQDYLVKGQTDGTLLLRAIRYATERNKIEEDLRREIEERQAAEMAVEAERQRLYALLDGLPAFVSLIAPDYSILFGNHVFKEVFGNWEGKRCYEVIFGKGEACENCPAVEVLENRTLSMKEMTVPGSGRVYNIYKYPFTDADGTALVLSLGIDITQRKRAEEALRESERNLRYLASQLLTAQEDERKRISRELHDELGQSLLVLKLQARAVQQSLAQEQQQLREECREILTNFDVMVDNVRRLSRDLSPTVLEDLGLSAALQQLIRGFSKHYRIKCSLQETNIDRLFPLETQVAIYRIFQECLTNIGKHSQATELTVSINEGYEHVSFIVQDNGRGFNQDQLRRQATDRGMGLPAMEERARMVGGILSVWSQEGRGTRTAFEIPIPPRRNR